MEPTIAGYLNKKLNYYHSLESTNLINVNHWAYTALLRNCNSDWSIKCLEKHYIYKSDNSQQLMVTRHL